VKSTLFLCALLFAFSGFVNADEYKFGVEGLLTTIDNQAPELIDCDLLTPPIPYQVCYSINSDATDSEPSTSVGLYTPTNVFVRIGDCSFVSDDHMYELKNEGPNGDEVYLGAWAPVDQNHHWQIGVWAADTSPSNFVESDDILPTAPDISLADRTQFIFDIAPEIHTEGPIEFWLRDAPFCESAGNILAQLIADVVVMELPAGISSGIEERLAIAIEILSNPNIPNSTGVVRQLESIANLLERQSGKKISEEDAAYLIDKLRQVIEQLN
jgi:hypothetical protein